MKNKMIAAVLVFTAFGLQSALAATYSEKTQYLGVVNGQMVGNRVVKVTRTPTDPILYRNNEAVLPKYLTVRNAEVRPASGDMVYITLKQALPDNQQARLILKVALMVDGEKSALSTRQQGEDVVISVPEATRQVELRTDAPAELEIPIDYRGNLQMILQVED
ncbi:fimbrial protein [Salmonella enterica]|nr:fimbrial protein [Salmonella enterica]EBP3563896.1 fimbrial protein [Salmonella enterica subsp. enterica]EDT1320199.1 fimbrial protein [Salmonella enterica subsp. enterica serovar Mississippi]EAX9069608.1 fimbrial protein [Salmonella enterica]EBI7611008.1 fimbrial protein [Salmonella enterica]